MEELGGHGGTNGLLAPTCNSVAKVGIFRTMVDPVTPPLHIHTINTHVLNDSYVYYRCSCSPRELLRIHRKVLPEDPRDLGEVVTFSGKHCLRPIVFCQSPPSMQGYQPGMLGEIPKGDKVADNTPTQ